MSRLLITTAFLLLLAAPLGAAGREWDLHYDRPAAAWTEALPVGNGRLGAMVFGGVARERIGLNEDSLWTGAPHSYAHPGAVDSLGEIRQLLLDGKQREAEQLATRTFMSQPLRQQWYQPLGDLVIESPHAGGEISDYRRGLSLNAAVATTSYTHNGVRHTRRVFASHPDHLIIVRLECDRPGALSFAAALETPHQRNAATTSDQRTIRLTGRVDDRGRPEPHQPASEVGFAACLRVYADGGSVRAAEGGARIEVADASSATLVLAARTNVQDYKTLGGDPAAAAQRDVSAADGASFAELLARHTDDHRALFNRVSLSLGPRPEDADSLPTDQRVLAAQDRADPDLSALLFHYGRYLMIASSRPGGQPANLQGVWNEDMAPAWGSKYTININTEMNYWLTDPCGLPECAAPLYDAIAELAEAGAEVARSHYGAAGWVAHHNFDRWRGAAPINASNHGIWPTGGAWLCQHLWNRYAFSGDEQFLRQTAYPVLKGASTFFADYLIEDPRSEEGWVISGPSNSPEQGGLVMGPTMDHQIIRALFEYTIAASETLRIDPELRERLTELRARIAPNQIGQHGQLQEWMEDLDNPSNRHRHVSHLWGVFPGDEISPDTPELFDAARTSLELRGDGGTGWSRAWKVNLWARLRDGDRAERVLAGLLTLTDSPLTDYRGGGVYPNLFDAHPPFQIDGNFGATSGICEMLVQSHRTSDDGRRLIELLPALPAAWPDGQVKGLCTRDGLVIDLKWKNGKFAECDVTSTQGGVFRFVFGPRYSDEDFAAGDQTKLRPGKTPVLTY